MTTAEVKAREALASLDKHVLVDLCLEQLRSNFPDSKITRYDLNQFSNEQLINSFVKTAKDIAGGVYDVIR